MITEIRERLNEYALWLRDKTSLREIGQYVEITTPYLDRHNDYLQIYARKEGNSFLLTDDGYILDDLEQSGCKLESPKRRQLLQLALNGFGIQLRGKELVVSSTTENFPVKKHNLVQAMLAINDMFYLAEPVIASIFYEDVISWLDMNDIRYTSRVKLTGKSGYDHHFDFVIPKSKISPERILQAINSPNKNTATILAFEWVDTREIRTPDSRAYALLNDIEQSVPIEVLDALRNYEIRPVLWSERQKIEAELAS